MSITRQTILAAIWPKGHQKKRLAALILLAVLIAVAILARLGVSADSENRQMADCINDYISATRGTNDEAADWCRDRLSQTSYSGDVTSNMTDIPNADSGPEFDRSGYAVEQAANEGRLITDLPAKFRVVKNSWRWIYEGYGSQPVAGANPAIYPYYDNKVIDPAKYATDSTYEFQNSLLQVSETAVPGIANVDLAITCPTVSTKVKTDTNGNIEILESDLRSLGCPSAASAKVSLAHYGQYGGQSDPTYNYYFSDKESSLATNKTNVLVGYRPAVLGQIRQADGTPVNSGKVCLFYRETPGNEACDKAGLSVSDSTDATGRFAVYASWGDYQQKGGKQAYLLAEISGQRYRCSSGFTIDGSRPTAVNCIIGEAIGATTSLGSQANRPSNDRTRFNQPASGTRTVSGQSDDCPPATTGSGTPKQATGATSTQQATSSNNTSSTGSRTDSSLTGGGTSSQSGRAGSGSALSVNQYSTQGHASLVACPDTAPRGYAAQFLTYFKQNLLSIFTGRRQPPLVIPDGIQQRTIIESPSGFSK